MSQIDVNIIEPIPYIQIMQGVGPKGDKGDKGDTGEVTQAEFDELSDKVTDIRENLTLAMEGIFEIENFKVSVDNTNFSDNILVQNGSTYGTIYMDYDFSIPPSALEKTGVLSWTVNNGVIYSNAVDVSENRSGLYVYGQWDGDSRKSNEPIITGTSTFYLDAKSGAMGDAIGMSAKITYCDRINYGVAASGSLTDAFLLTTLTGHTLSETKDLTFTVNAGTNNYIWVALPNSYGTPKFTVGGFEGGFTSQGSFIHTNNLSYRTNYTLWRSDNKGLGNVTVTIS